MFTKTCLLTMIALFHEFNMAKGVYVLPSHRNMVLIQLYVRKKLILDLPIAVDWLNVKGFH